MLKNVPEAEDMLQETFIKIFDNLPKFDPSYNFYTWANRIAVNSCINHQNKKGVDYTYDYDDKIMMKQAHKDYSEEDTQLTVELVNKCILLLPNGYREILNLYLLEGYDHQEIAEILKISVSTSKSQYARAKKKLRELIVQQNG